MTPGGIFHGRDAIRRNLQDAVRSLLVVPDLGFRLSYPVFSRPRLSRLFGSLRGLLVLCLGISGCPMEQPQMPGLPGQWDRQLPA